MSCEFHVWLCSSLLPACLFFPFGVVFVVHLFNFIIKNPKSLHLSPRPDRTDQPRWGLSRGGNRQPWVQGVKPDHWGLRQGLRGSGSPVGYGGGLPHGVFLGRPSRALQIPDALWAPRGFTGGVHQSGSEFKRLNLQDGVRSRARSAPWADRVRSRARSAPWADRVRSRASPTLAPLCAHCSRPSSTPRAWPTSLLVIFLFSVCGASGIRSLKGGLCHGPVGVPRLATRCLCVLSTWLVVCWCHMLPCRLSVPSHLVT